MNLYYLVIFYEARRMQKSLRRFIAQTQENGGSFQVSYALGLDLDLVVFYEWCNRLQLSLFKYSRCREVNAIPREVVVSRNSKNIGQWWSCGQTCAVMGEQQWIAGRCQHILLINLLIRICVLTVSIWRFGTINVLEAHNFVITLCKRSPIGLNTTLESVCVCY